MSCPAAASCTCTPTSPIRRHRWRLFASELSGLPFSFTAHAKDIYTSDSAQLREKIALARFVVTCTEYNRRHLLDLAGGARTPIHRIYHGIDTRLFAGDGDVNHAPSPPFRLLTVARLIAKKGIPTILQALKILRERGIALDHTLIGDGPDRDRIVALIARLGLSGVCRWIGSRPHDVVLAHYRRADLFVLGCEVAADGDRDGIPNVLFEEHGHGGAGGDHGSVGDPGAGGAGENGAAGAAGRSGGAGRRHADDADGCRAAPARHSRRARAGAA